MKTVHLQSTCNRERKQEGRLQSEFRQGKQAAWLDGQMDEETDG